MPTRSLPNDPSLEHLRKQAELAHLEAMIQLLIAHGADLNAPSPAGKTLLDRALARGSTDFANVLRAHGARTSAEAG